MPLVTSTSPTRRLALVGLSLSSMSKQLFSTAYKPVPNVDQTRRCIEISPPEGTEVKAALVFMHGLGDTASGWGGAMMEVASKVRSLSALAPYHSIPFHFTSLHFTSLHFTTIADPWVTSISTNSIQQACDYQWGV